LRQYWAHTRIFGLEAQINAVLLSPVYNTTLILPSALSSAPPVHVSPSTSNHLELTYPPPPVGHISVVIHAKKLLRPLRGIPSPEKICQSAILPLGYHECTCLNSMHSLSTRPRSWLATGQDSIKSIFDGIESTPPSATTHTSLARPIRPSPSYPQSID
jgi:hypothetical protein